MNILIPIVKLHRNQPPIDYHANQITGFHTERTLALNDLNW